jgi:hypothetical protein
MDDMSTTMRRTRRAVLGIALLGAARPLLAAATPRRRVAAARLDAALAAIASDPACELASLSALLIALYRGAILGQTPDGGA